MSLRIFNIYTHIQMGYFEVNEEYGIYTPFNDSKYFHDCSNCPVSCNIEDFNDKTQLELCRLVGLPDLNQSNSFVNDTLISWVKEYIIDKWKGDGIRLDTIPEIEPNFWGEFTNNAGVYSIGEYFNGDPAKLGPYQSYMDGLLSYPMYYTLRDVFGYNKYSMTNIDQRIQELNNNFIDITLLGTFIDNHDNNRFLCDYPSTTYREYINALTFTLTFNSIPIIYYGTEKGFNGCRDPLNREPLWTAGYSTNDTVISQTIKIANNARKHWEIYNEYYDVLYTSNSYYAFKRGDHFLVILTNKGYETDVTGTIVISNAGLINGMKYCNLFWPLQDCFTYQESQPLTICLSEGEPKIYVSATKLHTWDYMDINVFNHDVSTYGCPINEFKRSCNIANGCNDTNPSTYCDIEFIPRSVYGCATTWDDVSNINNACGEGYKICDDESYAQYLGLTNDLCSSYYIPTNAFYAGYVSESLNDNTCVNGNMSTGNNIFGCSSPLTSWVNDTNNCGVLTSVLNSNGIFGEGSQFGWNLTDPSRINEELFYVSKSLVSNQNYGGVLCCLDGTKYPTETPTNQPTLTPITLGPTTGFTDSELNSWNRWSAEHVSTTCSDTSACANNALVSCDVEFLPNLVYGCSGLWENTGIQNGEWICGEDYEICNQMEQLNYVGLTKEICSTYPPFGKFYATRITSYNGHTCYEGSPDGTYSTDPWPGNNVFGCALDDINNPYYTISRMIDDNVDFQCDPLTALIGINEYGSNTYTNNGWSFPSWENIASNERWGVYKTAHNIGGGVMCCKKRELVNITRIFTDNDINNWEPFSVEYDKKGKCNTYGGCTRTTNDATCDVEFVKDKIYGCGGEWENSGIESGNYLCRQGYHICSRMEELIDLGLTKEMCSTYPEKGNFYGTLVTGYDDYNPTCIEANMDGTYNTDPWPGNNIYGCALDSMDNPYYTISEWKLNDDDTVCNPLTARLTTHVDATEYGWNFHDWNDINYKEKWGVTKNSIRKGGGVMCCRDSDLSSTKEIEYIQKMRSFWIPRIAEIIALILTVIMFISLLTSIAKHRVLKQIEYRSSPHLWLMKYLLYAVFTVSILSLVVKLLGTWLLIGLNNEVFYTCKSKFYVINTFSALYKILFYQFLIIRLKCALEGSVLQYANWVYWGVTIYNITYNVTFCILTSIPDNVTILEWGAVTGFTSIYGNDCYPKIKSRVLVYFGIFDTILCIVILALFFYKFLKLIRSAKDCDAQIQAHKKLKRLMFKNIYLSIIAIVTTWIVFYAGFNQLQGTADLFQPFDDIINNLSIFLMFKFNESIFLVLCCCPCVYCTCLQNDSMAALKSYILSTKESSHNSSKGQSIRMNSGSINVDIASPTVELGKTKSITHFDTNATINNDNTINPVTPIPPTSPEFKNKRSSTKKGHWESIDDGNQDETNL